MQQQAHSDTPGTHLDEYDDAGDSTTGQLRVPDSLEPYGDDEIVTAPWPPYTS